MILIQLEPTEIIVSCLELLLFKMVLILNTLNTSVDNLFRLAKIFPFLEASSKFFYIKILAILGL